MGRKSEPGINFYPMNANHTLHTKLRLLHSKLGGEGYWIFSCLLDKIYLEKGYYLDVSEEDSIGIFASDHCRSNLNFLNEVIAFCVEKNIFDKTVFKNHKVLTSKRIQLNYITACRERARKGTTINIERKYFLCSAVDFREHPDSYKNILLDTGSSINSLIVRRARHNSNNSSAEQSDSSAEQSDSSAEQSTFFRGTSAEELHKTGKMGKLPLSEVSTHSNSLIVSEATYEKTPKKSIVPRNNSIDPRNNSILPRNNSIDPRNNSHSRVEYIESIIKEDSNCINLSNTLKSSFKSKDLNEKQVFDSDEKISVDETDVGKEEGNGSSKPEAKAKRKSSRKPRRDPDAEPHWQSLIKVWYSFNIKNFGEKPSFDGQDPSHMHRIIEQLRKRADDQKLEWTKELAIERWSRFLESAFQDEWISKHFLLQNLYTQKDTIFLNQKQVNGKSVNGSTNGFNKNGFRNTGAIASIGRDIDFDNP